MAEIRSTMDLVMERAAKMGKASTEEIAQESARKNGMEIAAEYLKSRQGALTEILAQAPSTQQDETRKGILDVLLRNIFLAKDDIGIERVGDALTGIVELSGNAGDLSAICQELQGIIGQYGKHRDQYYEQLKEQMRMQIEQMIAQQTGGPVDGLKIDPTMEPKFQEEWTRIEGELNGQYEQALDQYRGQLRMLLGV